MGLVLILEKVALRCAMQKVVCWPVVVAQVPFYNVATMGLLTPSCSSHGGNLLERREKERRKWESFEGSKDSLAGFSEIC